ncbi:MAG TPA: hypothetical protein VE544_07900 [Nitrososphaeraceae archaeon]|jgi:hypothetical protein|nr:hypothetical protein [Nitrososphaeraceae archaeon]
MALLLNLSDNYLKQAQNNTEVVQQEVVDLMGLFESTTSATALAFLIDSLLSVI